MPPRQQPAASPGDTAVLAALTRMVARYIISQAPGTSPATFRQIAVGQLGVATNAEADVIEAWLEAHP